MKKFSLTPFLTVACLALLTSCASDAPMVVKPDMPTTSKINLDVQTISLVDRSGPQSSDSPYNTNHFQPTIAEAVRQWASAHLQATGTSGEAIVIIKDASLTSQPLPFARDFFTRQQSSKYTGHAEVEIDIKGRGDDFAIGNADATRYQSLPEDPTDLEKQNAYTIILNGLIRDLGQNIDNSLHEHMQRYMGGGAPVIDNGVGTGPRH
jgi:hypothetical protein